MVISIKQQQLQHITVLTTTQHHYPSFKHLICFIYNSLKTNKTHKSFSTTVKLPRYHDRLYFTSYLTSKTTQGSTLKVSSKTEFKNSSYCSLNRTNSLWRVGLLASRAHQDYSLWRAGMLASRALRIPRYGEWVCSPRALPGLLAVASWVCSPRERCQLLALAS